MGNKFLVVGLGNIGDEYANTRHNIGFNVVDCISQKLSCTLSLQKSCRSLVGKHVFENKISCIISKPCTFMNHSGVAVLSLLQWYEISPDHCIIITDNIDLPVGTIRIKANTKKTGSGGITHNGIRSIQASLQSLDNNKGYIRMYIGVGSHRSNESLAKYVLSKWHASESQDYQNVIELAANSIITCLSSINSNNSVQEQLQSIIQKSSIA